MTISVDALQKYAATVLKRVGLSDTDAAAAANVLVTTDSWGIFTHGVKNLNHYVRRLQAGGLQAEVSPNIVAEGPAWAVIDGQSTIGMVGSVAAMRVAIEKARTQGIGYAGLRNSCHFGAAGYYAVMAAHEGMLGIAVANGIPSMTVPGGRGRIMGNNPFAFAAPAPPGNPIFIDMALSAVAGGKLVTAQSKGQSIPSTWSVNASGLPTTDPNDFLFRGGSLAPMAGHKGYGLALMVEILTALLSGAAMRDEILLWIQDDPSLPTGEGAAFIAINVGMIVPWSDFAARIGAMAAAIRNSPLAAGASRIYLPGEIEWDHRAAALRCGLTLPPDVATNVRLLAQEFDVDLTGARKGVTTDY